MKYLHVGAAFVMAIAALPGMAYDTDAQVREKLKTAKVTIEMESATMADMLNRVSEQAKIKIVFDEGVPKEVRDIKGTLKTKDKAVEAVLKAILDPAKLDFTVKGGAVRIVKK